MHSSQLREAEVPKAYQHLTLEGIQSVRFQKLAKHYLQNFWELAEAGKAPALLGRAGTYKTWTASVVATYIRDTALLDVAFMQCAVELQDLERRRFEPYVSLRLDWLGKVPFLVLDDFTKPRPNSFAQDMLDGIVEKRYADGLPTLFTGNVQVSKDDWTVVADQFGAGFCRRMREMTAGLAVVGK